MFRYLHPNFLMPLATKALPWFWIVTAFLFVLGLWGAFYAPPDYQQGLSIRIMYLHVPAAWMSLFIYVVMMSASLGTLVWRHPFSSSIHKSAAPLGALFTFICLTTGSLWGKPMWGTWWVWDARLTSMLVLFVLYIGLILLWHMLEESAHADRMAAILTLVGGINLPIIKFSVEWWSTLHQPASVFRLGGPTIAFEMLWPLLVMAFAFTCLFVVFLIMAVRNDLLVRKIRRRMLELTSPYQGPARAVFVEEGVADV